MLPIIVISLLCLLTFPAYLAYPSGPGEQLGIITEEELRAAKKIILSLFEATMDDQRLMSKRNQEVMTAFGKLNELRQILKSG